MNDATHTWSMQKVDGDYADPTMRLVLIPTDMPTEDTMHGLESGVEALIEGDCTVVEDGETMTSIATEGSCFELHVGTGDDSTFTIDTTGITGMSMYAQHVPTEFERDQHYLKDSAGTDIEPIAQEGAGAHGDHGDDHDDHGDDHGDAMCHNTETHENYESTQEDCEAAGHMWVEDHEGHEGECHNTSTHENYESTESECEAAGHVWMDDHSEQEIVADGDEEAFDFDPHSWLDPLSYKTQVGVVLDALIAAFPSGEAAFTENAAAYMGQLDSLHSDFDSAFGSTNTCTGTSIAANHNAYAYMAERYDLEFVTVHGLDPEGEPSAADILEVIEKIEEEGITVFFVEEYTSQAAVAAIVEQTNGIEIKILYTMELQPSDSEDNYISMMRKNLEGLKSGLGC